MTLTSNFLLSILKIILYILSDYWHIFKYYNLYINTQFYSLLSVKVLFYDHVFKTKIYSHTSMIYSRGKRIADRFPKRYIFLILMCSCF